ncbi:MAG: four helix bundle protein [Flavisolibacter sp.]
MEPHRFSFEKLVVWQDAKDLTVKVYQLTREFPSEEKFALVQQIRRSATSVCANIAEGSSRTTAKDQAHFTTMAYASLVELLNHLLIAKELRFIDDAALDELRNVIQAVSIKLSGLKKSQLSKIKGLNLFFLLIFSWSIYAPLKPLTF